MPAKILRLFERGSVFNNHKVLSGLAGKIAVLLGQFVAKKIAGKKGRAGNNSRFAVILATNDHKRTRMNTERQATDITD